MSERTQPKLVPLMKMNAQLSNIIASRPALFVPVAVDQNAPDKLGAERHAEYLIQSLARSGWVLLDIDLCLGRFQVKSGTFTQTWELFCFSTDNVGLVHAVFTLMEPSNAKRQHSFNG
ncbi:hypothetical protein [Vibrio superstes]|uniref:Uncharacterized protein n=1 Tax=Vibrio superstes NBRC 103154 TaxID=1219062 RepID=A0A511QRE8_9VIBR|nr:hypothetical protein [Vibrio superstes]GEM79903.1 hypothetical protein VSU01S_21480 [Vibrio superstes NBRC 103154]